MGDARQLLRAIALRCVSGSLGGTIPTRLPKRFESCSSRSRGEGRGGRRTCDGWIKRCDDVSVKRVRLVLYCCLSLWATSLRRRTLGYRLHSPLRRDIPCPVIVPDDAQFRQSLHRHVLKAIRNDHYRGLRVRFVHTMTWVLRSSPPGCSVNVWSRSFARRFASSLVNRILANLDCAYAAPLSTNHASVQPATITLHTHSGSFKLRLTHSPYSSAPSSTHTESQRSLCPRDSNLGLPLGGRRVGYKELLVQLPNILQLDIPHMRTMPSPAFNDHTTAEEVAAALQNSIKGKNGALRHAWTSPEGSMTHVQYMYSATRGCNDQVPRCRVPSRDIPVRKEHLGGGSQPRAVRRSLFRLSDIGPYTRFQTAGCRR